MSTRLYLVVDEMTKEANFSNIVNTLKSNPGATTGAVLGGAFGGYKGSTAKNPDGTPSRDAGLKGGILGAAQGALGGALGGHVIHKAGKATFGKDNVFSRFKKNTQRLDTEMADKLGDNMQYYSRGANKKALKNMQKQEIADVKQNVSGFSQKADAGMMEAADARKLVDEEVAKNVFTERGALKQQMLFGGIGSAMALGTAGGLINEARKAGQEPDSKVIAQNLYQKYQRDGKLSPREMALLQQKVKGVPTKKA